MDAQIDNLKYEKDLYKEGYSLIAGIDEVGRGPLVGPVVTACVILPKNFKLEGLTDSKKLSEKKREYFFDIYKQDKKDGLKKLKNFLSIFYTSIVIGL